MKIYECSCKLSLTHWHKETRIGFLKQKQSTSIFKSDRKKLYSPKILMFKFMKSKQQGQYPIPPTQFSFFQSIPQPLYSHMTSTLVTWPALYSHMTSIKSPAKRTYQAHISSKTSQTHRTTLKILFLTTTISAVHRIVSN